MKRIGHVPSLNRSKPRALSGVPSFHPSPLPPTRCFRSLSPTPTRPIDGLGGRRQTDESDPRFRFFWQDKFQPPDIVEVATWRGHGGRRRGRRGRRGRDGGQWMFCLGSVFAGEIAKVHQGDPGRHFKHIETSFIS